MFKNRLELLKFDANNAYYLNFYEQVPIVYIASLFLTFLNILHVWVFFS